MIHLSNYCLLRFRKQLFLSLLLLILTNVVSAQGGIQNKMDPHEYKPFIIELKKKVDKGLSGKQHFVFFEERGDTTRIGFLRGESNSQFYFKFPEAAVTYLDKKLNRDEQGQSDLYIGIKRLWLSQAYIPSGKTKAILWSERTQMSYSRVICNFYKKTNGQYELLYTFDSTISKKGYLGNNNDELMSRNINTMILTADSIGNSNVTTVMATGINRPVLPIIFTTTKPNDGIYLTYADFLADKPAELAFDYIVTRTEKIELAQKRADDSLYERKCWGFCKEGILYMHTGDVFSRLTKIENTFELRGSDVLQLRYSKEKDAFLLGYNVGYDLAAGLLDYAIFDLATQKKSPTFISYMMAYKLDFETGQVY
jgi:hypothetical protein